MLRVPELVEAVMPFVLFTSIDSTLPARHRALLVLRTAWLTQSSYLWADHVPAARATGVMPDEIRRVAEGPDAAGWDPFEATLLRLADELYVNSSVRDATWDALAARYDLYNLFDAVMAVNETTLVAMLYNSWGVQPDDNAYARFPADVPYPPTVPAPEPPLTTPRVAPLEGPGIRVGRTFGRYPALQTARSGQSGYVNRISPLTPYFRELLILRIGWNCQAVYEWAKHVGSVGRARDHGLEPERIALGAGRRLGRVRGGARTRGGRDLPRRNRLPGNVGHAGRTVRHARDDERGDDRRQLPPRLDVAQRARRPAARTSCFRTWTGAERRVYCNTCRPRRMRPRCSFRASGAVVRALGRMARQRRQSRSELIRAILEDALRIESRDDDPVREARRQSLLVSRRDSERETLDFIEQVTDTRDWR